MRYKHTQIGYLMLFVILGVMLLFAYIGVQEESSVFLLRIVMIGILLVLASFSYLMVTIDTEYISVRFGYGVFKKRFALKDIQTVRAVKNSWYYGWGIRVWFWPKMWIYNISGFDAVELTMKDGSIVRIGTDEPQLLEQELLKVCK